MDRISRNVSAPQSDLKVPEFFILTLTFLIPRSLPLLSGGMSGSSRKLNRWSLHLISPSLILLKSSFVSSVHSFISRSSLSSHGCLSILSLGRVFRSCIASRRSSSTRWGQFHHLNRPKSRKIAAYIAISLQKSWNFGKKNLNLPPKRTFCLKPYNNNLYYNYEKSPIYYLWSVGSHGHDRQ